MVPESVGDSFFTDWAKEVVGKNGPGPARTVLQDLGEIRKEADITPEMAERWNEALLPFIQASERALKEALKK